MAIEDRLRRLEGDDPVICAECPYSRPPLRLESTVVHYPDGSTDVMLDPKDPGNDPPELCNACPFAPGAELHAQRPLRFIEARTHVYPGREDA